MRFFFFTLSFWKPSKLITFCKGTGWTVTICTQQRPLHICQNCLYIQIYVRTILTIWLLSELHICHNYDSTCQNYYQKTTQHQRKMHHSKHMPPKSYYLLFLFFFFIMTWTVLLSQLLVEETRQKGFQFNISDKSWHLTNSLIQQSAKVKASMLSRNRRSLSKCLKLNMSVRALLHLRRWMHRNVSSGLAPPSWQEGFGLRGAVPTELCTLQTRSDRNTARLHKWTSCRFLVRGMTVTPQVKEVFLLFIKNFKGTVLNMRKDTRRTWDSLL